MASSLGAHVSLPATADGGTWLHRFACFTAACTLVLIFAGGLVTSTGSGLAVPDWPLSFGQVMPEMTGGVLFEHGHRLIASFVGLLTVALAAWLVVTESRASVRGLGLAAAIAVIGQGILGGVTVLYQLPPQVSVAHACLAQAFLCLAVTLAVVTGPGWLSRSAVIESSAVRTLSLATASAVYAQLILGAIMRHTGAGLAIPDFPLAFGRLVPPWVDPAVRIHYMHRLMAVVVVLLVCATVAAALRHGASWLRWPALTLAGLVAIQVTLGALTVLSRKQPWIASSHVACGAGLLATAVVLMLRTRRVGRIAGDPLVA